MTRPLSLLPLVTAVLFIAGCAATATLRGGLAAAEKRLEQIEANGAYVCAPKELALAKAHMNFARLEIEQGMGSRANEHYEIAMQNLELADKKSPPDKCAGPSVVVPKNDCVDSDGDFICANVDKCPQQAEDFDGIQDEDGCPEDQDTDRDGIFDSVDQCIVDAEDKDGYQDEDGCPDFDNDGDSVLDVTDNCPMEAEDPDGYKDEDGCPDVDNDNDKILDVDDECPNVAGIESEKGCPKKYEGVEITQTRIEIKQKIFFAYNKAKIKKKSYRILATVAEVLTDNPDITVRVEGHTDSRGKDAYNKRLSTKRAKSVLEHLVKKGKISRSRLTSIGWGEEKPIDSNQTDEGRAANRRVEFVRTDIPE